MRFIYSRNDWAWTGRAATVTACEQGGAHAARQGHNAPGDGDGDAMGGGDTRTVHRDYRYYDLGTDLVRVPKSGLIERGGNGRWVASV